MKKEFEIGLPFGDTLGVDLERCSKDLAPEKQVISSVKMEPEQFRCDLELKNNGKAKNITIFMSERMGHLPLKHDYILNVTRIWFQNAIQNLHAL